MEIETPISDEMNSYSDRYAGAHGGGSFTPSAIREIERLLRSVELRHTAETGCGKSTILFSILSAEHTIFTIDDRQYGEQSSLNFVLDYPKTNKQVLRAVFGPSQRTLPRHNFEALLDAVLIDGPHGFPFPELEYYYFYPQLREGALFFVDDIHLPSLGRFWDIIKEDRMFEQVTIIENTGVLRRTSVPTFDPFGDGWWEQRYNQRRLTPDAYHYATD
jgi:hypothetical protein